MLHVELVVRDDQGVTLDPATLGIDGVVAIARARPPDGGTSDPPAGGPWGPALASLEHVEAMARQVAALRVACVVGVGEESADGPGGERVLDELMASLVVSRRSAQRTRNQAEATRVDGTVWAALAAGLIDPTRAQILGEALLQIPLMDEEGIPRAGAAEQRRQLAVESLPYAQEHTARRLALWLQRRLTALGCPNGSKRRQRALAERGVWIAHDGDGTSELTARLASEDAERVYAVLRAIALADRNGEPPAQECPGPNQPLGPWLAAALVDVVLGTGGTSGRTGPVPEVVVHVTIPVTSLAGLTDEPATLNGFGVVPADVARRLAAGDSRWRHVLTSRTDGALLDVGRLSYRPPAALARHVRLRDSTCRFPGCAVPARECDLDHLVPFPAGPTPAGNLHALCRRHHGLKHEGGWLVDAVDGGGLRWRSPQGACATTWPDDVWANAPHPAVA